MSNVKEVEILATVPWDWAGRLPDSDAALIAGLFLNPACGLSLTQNDQGYVPNAIGGRTSTYDVVITGMEAVAWPMLDRLVAALRSVGEVSEAWARDCEPGNDGEWCELGAVGEASRAG